MVKIDLIIVGNSGAGKTCLVKRYIQNESEGFSMKQDPSIGMDLFSKTIQVNDQNIKINIWDTAGQDKYFSLTRGLFQKADGVLLAFDLTDTESFKKVQDYWIQQVIENSDISVKKILIGNKVDMQKERKVKTLEGAELAQKFKMSYFETSAKTGEGVAAGIESLAKMCAFAIQESRISISENNFALNPNQPKRMNCFDKIKNISNKLFGMVGLGKSSKKEPTLGSNSNNTHDNNNSDTTTLNSDLDALRQQQLQELTKIQEEEQKNLSSSTSSHSPSIKK